MRGLARRFFCALGGLYRRMPTHAAPSARSGNSEQRGSRLLARKYLAKWLTFRGLMTALRIRNGNVNLHASKAHKRLASIYLASGVHLHSVAVSVGRQGLLSQDFTTCAWSPWLVVTSKSCKPLLVSIVNSVRNGQRSWPFSSWLVAATLLGHNWTLGCRLCRTPTVCCRRCLEHVSFNPAISPSSRRPTSSRSSGELGSGYTA